MVETAVTCYFGITFAIKMKMKNSIRLREVTLNNTVIHYSSIVNCSDPPTISN